MTGQAATDAAPPRRGEALGRFVVLDRVGSGGAGEVYAAVRSIKLLRPREGSASNAGVALTGVKRHAKPAGLRCRSTRRMAATTSMTASHSPGWASRWWASAIQSRPSGRWSGPSRPRRKAGRPRVCSVRRASRSRAPSGRSRARARGLSSWHVARAPIERRSPQPSPRSTRGCRAVLDPGNRAAHSPAASRLPSRSVAELVRIHDDEDAAHLVPAVRGANRHHRADPLT